jgi:hypothetical protein
MEEGGRRKGGEVTSLATFLVAMTTPMSPTQVLPHFSNNKFQAFT